MNSQTSVSRSRLEHAEALLREILVEDFAGDNKGDAGTLNRMLVHLTNMHQAVSLSPDDEANVAKRLGDFAKSMSRVTPPKPGSVARLNRLAEALESARDGLKAEAQGDKVASGVAPGTGETAGAGTLVS
ncbi:MAG TPA: hypothetical protein VMF52_09490 [Steroidobacteraceae bacterium]|nr:hypothetical protein [Steroidobacteraceae bacterium]